MGGEAARGARRRPGHSRLNISVRITRSHEPDAATHDCVDLLTSVTSSYTFRDLMRLAPVCVCVFMGLCNH